MNGTSFEMERGIARCRVALSLIAILAIYVDPTEPTLTRWLPLSGGTLTLSRYWVITLVSHLVFSVGLLVLTDRRALSLAQLARIASIGDVLFAAAVALVTEGTTSPFYSFFAFAVLTVGLRSGLRAALWATSVSVLLYVGLIVTSAPTNQVFFIVMRAAYIAITGYLVGYLGQVRLDQDTRIRELEASGERERIARSLHDGYGQALAGVNLRLETIRELFSRGREGEALTELSELQSGVNREHDELRAYIRSLVDLETSPRRLPGGNARVSVRVDFRGAAAFVEHVLLIILEGVRNIRRHAEAREATIGMRATTGGLLLTIDDDGVGFRDGAGPPWSMMSRVAECGGRLTLAGNGAPGGHLLIELPEG